VKKLLGVAVAALVLLTLAGAAVVWSWTRTPYGTLDLGAAMNVKSMPSGIDELTPEARATANAWAARFAPEPGAIGAIQEATFATTAGPQRARVYVPEGGGPHPLVVWIHGGGFWMGDDLEAWDGLVTPLVREIPAVVVSLGYRLAPEHPFPAAVEDCWDGLRWAVEHASDWNADPARVAVTGGSAGGNLAAVMAIRARDEGGPHLRMQALTVPTLNAGGEPTESMERFSEGYGLDGIPQMRGAYFAGPGDKQHRWASPLTQDDLHGLAPAVIVTAEFDPLRDEGEAYGRRLREAGVPAVVRRYDGAIHGFMGSPDDSAAAMEFTIAELRKALH
jgi:acetyl esterase